MSDPAAWMSLSSMLALVVQLALELKLDLPTAHRHRGRDVDWNERHRELDRMLVELLAGASRYGFSVEEVLSRLHERQEVS